MRISRMVLNYLSHYNLLVRVEFFCYASWASLSWCSSNIQSKVKNVNNVNVINIIIFYLNFIIILFWDKVFIQLTVVRKNISGK